MNGFRTFLASLDFTDDRIAVASTETVEGDTQLAADVEVERTDEHQIAA